MIRIFVEGSSDKKFIEQYIEHVFGQKIYEEIVVVGGWTVIKSEKFKSMPVFNKIVDTTNNGGKNLVIFDADISYEDRAKTVKNFLDNNDLDYELFLFPDNQNSGELENLLEKMIPEQNLPILDCWDGYEKCLGEKEGIVGISLSIPPIKSKIYAYLETLSDTSKMVRKKLNPENRDFLNSELWNLDSDVLKPLRDFLTNTFQEYI